MKQLDVKTKVMPDFDFDVLTMILHMKGKKDRPLLQMTLNSGRGIKAEPVEEAPTNETGLLKPRRITVMRRSR